MDETAWRIRAIQNPRIKQKRDRFLDFVTQWLDQFELVVGVGSRISARTTIAHPVPLDSKAAVWCVQLAILLEDCAETSQEDDRHPINYQKTENNSPQSAHLDLSREFVAYENLRLHNRPSPSPHGREVHRHDPR